MAAALAKVVNNRGDHILVCEGSTTSEVIPSLVGMNGFSPQYPLVIQSYNPAAPTDTTYWGRGYERNARPKLTGVTGHGITPQSGAVNPPNFLAIRGFDFNTAALTDLSIYAYSTNNTPGSFWLLEGNLFGYHSISFAMIVGDGLYPRNQALMSDTIIIRNNSGRGNFSTTQSEGGSGIYLDGWKGAIVIEDNVWYHRAWKEGAVRGDDYTIGGPNKFKHTAYVQTTNDGTPVWRRNLSADGSADGGQFRRGGYILENMFLDCPIPITCGGGTRFDLYQTNGIYGEVAYNAIFGSPDFAVGDPAGEAIAVQNTTSLSTVHHNVIARAFNPATSLGTFVISSDYAGTKTIIDLHNNIAYAWAGGGNTFGGADPFNQVTSSYENNCTDAPASGSNLNISSLTAPNPYTPAELYTAIYAAVPAVGAATKTAFIEYAIANPEAHVQRTARQLIMDGFGMTNALGNLAMRSSWIVGTASTIEFIGGTPGSTFTASLPAAFTLNSATRSITYDGTGGTTSGNFTITETPLLGSPKVNTVAYAVQAAPATFNPADKGTNAAVTGGNLTVQVSSGFAAIRATRAVSGKNYWEEKVVTIADGWAAGICDGSANLNIGSYWGNGGISGVIAHFTPGGNGTVTMHATDDTAKLYWYGANGTWTNGNPAAGTGGTSYAGFASGVAYPAWQGDFGDKVLGNFGAGSYDYPAPTGFTNV
jgi:hypothetical protein